ncbi:BglG family transcription antiterminator LicT [Candidatus Enterococcus ferrettii]|uniref:Beta-glucoside operon transcriptional antiterminator n=1 Tax=Candidatus Enterococcus ferrettii TaxID=2815324 RepID=A0ABV0EMH4_9ENTE|nr:PRD domain-containing protein [Enterococcus sp. 665A]MBO1338265.1 PRD domain-containing protein [Enterococcus sp. 665A]
MIIKKKYNNNIALVADGRKLEHVVLGRGVAFNKNAGDEVDPETIEKTFVLKSEDTIESFLKLLDEIPVNYLELTNQVVRAAEKRLKVDLNESIYIGLADHINYALERSKNGNNLHNVLLWEIKQFYKKEFEAALESLKIIKYYENVDLSEDEAAFIALHFVNAQKDGEKMNQTIITTEVIHEIITILRYQFKITINEDSMSYVRFLSHLKFFLRRVFSKERETSVSIVDYQSICDKLPEITSCVDKISSYLERRLDIRVLEEEKFYLVLHINRIVNSEV